LPSSFRYRFTTSELLAKFENQKHLQVTRSRLATLEKQGYIGRRYDNSYKLQGKFAAFYLLPKGLQYLKSIDAAEPQALKMMYNDPKASDKFVDFCLQVMDHGTLTDNNGRKADFRNVVLIMTSNAGAEALTKSSIGFTQSQHQGDEMAEVKRLFTPEFRNRLDAMISFAPLDTVIILQVVDKFLMQLEAQLQDKKVEAQFSPALRDWLAREGFDAAMGARPMARLIQNTIRRALADELLFGRLVHGGKVMIDLDVREKVVLQFADAEQLSVANDA
jgi:ATP-dependent Clp protease ATP-binding subunit ClpA